MACQNQRGKFKSAASHYLDVVTHYGELWFRVKEVTSPGTDDHEQGDPDGCPDSPDHPNGRRCSSFNQTGAKFNTTRIALEWGHGGRGGRQGDRGRQAGRQAGRRIGCEVTQERRKTGKKGGRYLLGHNGGGN